MNPYKVVEMKMNGDVLSIKVEGPNGFWVWVHVGKDEVSKVMGGEE